MDSLKHLRFSRPPPPNGVPIVGAEMEAVYGPLVIPPSLTRLCAGSSAVSDRSGGPPYFPSQIPQFSAFHSADLLDSTYRAESVFSVSNLGFSDSCDTRYFSRSRTSSSTISERGGTRSSFLPNQFRQRRVDQFTAVSSPNVLNGLRGSNSLGRSPNIDFSASYDNRWFPRFGGRGGNRNKGTGGPFQNRGRRVFGGSNFVPQRSSQTGNKGMRSRVGSLLDVPSAVRSAERGEPDGQAFGKSGAADSEDRASDERTENDERANSFQQRASGMSKSASIGAMVELNANTRSDVLCNVQSCVSSTFCGTSEKGATETEGRESVRAEALRCGTDFGVERPSIGSSNWGDAVEECLLSHLPKMAKEHASKSRGVDASGSQKSSASLASHNYSPRQMLSIATGGARYGMRVQGVDPSVHSTRCGSGHSFGNFSDRVYFGQQKYRSRGGGFNRQRGFRNDVRNMNSGDEVDRGAPSRNTSRQSSMYRKLSSREVSESSDEKKDSELGLKQFEEASFDDDHADVNSEMSMDNASTDHTTTTTEEATEEEMTPKEQICTEKLQSLNPNLTQETEAPEDDSKVEQLVDGSDSPSEGSPMSLESASSEPRKKDAAPNENEDADSDRALSVCSSLVSQHAPGWISDDLVQSIVPPELSVGAISDYKYEVSKLDILSDDIWTKFCASAQTDVMLNRKLHLRDMLYAVITGLFPTCGLYVVGSSLNGFGTNSSDMDLCLMITNKELDQSKDAPEVLRQVKEALGKVPWIRERQLISAKVPILRLRFTEAFEDLVVDLNANNSVAIRNTHLLCYYSAFDWRVRPLVCVVKEWAKRRDINNANRSSFTSYSLCMMVIHYLQCGVSPQVLPSLQQLYPRTFHPLADVRLLNVLSPLETLPESVWTPNKTSSLGELLVGFLEYYAFKFDALHDAISVRLGRKIERAVVARQRGTYGNHNDIAQWNCICIEEPFTLSNTAHSVHNQMIFDAIRQAFVDSFIELDTNRDLDAFLNVSPIDVSMISSFGLSAHSSGQSLAGRGDSTSALSVECSAEKEPPKASHQDEICATSDTDTTADGHCSTREHVDKHEDESWELSKKGDGRDRQPPKTSTDRRSTSKGSPVVVEQNVQAMKEQIMPSKKEKGTPERGAFYAVKSPKKVKKRAVSLRAEEVRRAATSPDRASEWTPIASTKEARRRSSASSAKTRRGR